LFNGTLPYKNINNSNYLINRNNYNPIYMYFKIPTVLTKYRMYNGFAANIPMGVSYNDIGNQTPQAWNLYGSNDDVNWTLVDSRTSQSRFPYATSTDASSSAYVEYTISSPVAYKTYKLDVTLGGRDAYNCTKSGCSYDYQIGEIQTQ
jgi:hypothetical protein